MRSSLLSATLAVVAGVVALPSPQMAPGAKHVGALPVKTFADTPTFAAPVLPDDAKRIFEEHNRTLTEKGTLNANKPRSLEERATCSSVRVRTEWDSCPDSTKQAFVDAVKCLMNKAPSGQFSQAKSRYEDFVALHQTLTPNVHGNRKFLIWHRYFTWTFEDVLRTECGMTVSMPWFDETRYSGKFSQSSIFSSQWLGGLALGGACVTNGQFANLALNVGPGTANTEHCLARNGDASKTQYCDTAYVSQCNAYTDFAGMASCSETGPHAWGHNGIGSVMEDVYGSPGDPIFWLHHGFIDRNFRVWQNADSSRVSTIDGTDASGNELTLNTEVNVYGIRPNVVIGDILDTTGTTLCYKYNY